jgi:hypothetical protein
MTPRDRRTLIFGAGLIVALVLTAKGVPATVAWRRDKALESARASQLLAASSIDPRELRSARDSLAIRRSRLEAIDSVMPVAVSASAAVAQLASTLEDLADSCAVRVSAIQLRPDSVASSGLTEVSARLNAVADVAGLAAFVRAIAGSRAPLVVRELTVTAPEPAAPSSKAEALRFDVLVAGLSRTAAQGRP